MPGTSWGGNDYSTIKYETVRFQRATSTRRETGITDAS